MDPSLFVSSGATAVIAAYALQAVKKSPLFPWLTVETGRLNLAVSILIASLASLGIHYQWHGAEDGTLIITGLTLANLKAFVTHAAAQWTAQHVAYRSLVVPGELLGIIATQGKLNASGGSNVPPKTA